MSATNDLDAAQKRQQYETDLLREIALLPADAATGERLLSAPINEDLTLLERSLEQLTTDGLIRYGRIISQLRWGEREDLLGFRTYSVTTVEPAFTRRAGSIDAKWSAKTETISQDGHRARITDQRTIFMLNRLWRSREIIDARGNYKQEGKVTAKVDIIDAVEEDMQEIGRSLPVDADSIKKCIDEFNREMRAERIGVKFSSTKIGIRLIVTNKTTR